jgi:hypothetical protein
MTTSPFPMRLIITFHEIITFWGFWYFLLISNPMVDLIYLVYMFFLTFHWLYFDHECILNVLKKQQKNGDYWAGDAPDVSWSEYTHPPSLTSPPRKKFQNWIHLAGMSIMYFGFSFVLYRRFRNLYASIIVFSLGFIYILFCGTYTVFPHIILSSSQKVFLSRFLKVGFYGMFCFFIFSLVQESNSEFVRMFQCSNENSNVRIQKERKKIMMK